MRQKHATESFYILLHVHQNNNIHTYTTNIINVTVKLCCFTSVVKGSICKRIIMLFVEASNKKVQIRIRSLIFTFVVRICEEHALT